MNRSSGSDHAFTLSEQQAVYRAIYERRDMRHFNESLHVLVEQERLLTAQVLGEREDDFMKLKSAGRARCRRGAGGWGLKTVGDSPHPNPPPAREGVISAIQLNKKP